MFFNKPTSDVEKANYFKDLIKEQKDKLAKEIEKNMNALKGVCKTPVQELKTWGTTTWHTRGNSPAMQRKEVAVLVYNTIYNAFSNNNANELVECLCDFQANKELKTKSELAIILTKIEKQIETQVPGMSEAIANIHNLESKLHEKDQAPEAAPSTPPRGIPR